MLGVERDREHPPLPGELGHRLGAQSDDQGRVLEGEGTGDVGGGDLPLGVTDHSRGLDAAIAPEPGQGDHHGEESGLDDVEAIEPALVL